MIDYDDKSLFVCDLQKDWNQFPEVVKDSSSHPDDSNYFRVSKIDGSVLEYVVFPSNKVDLTYRSDGRRIMPNFSYMKRCTNGLFLCDPKTDTVFLYSKDQILIPVICKTPLVSSVYPMVILDDFVDAGKYQFIDVKTLYSVSDITPQFKERDYIKSFLVDKKTGEIFRQKVNLPDYKGKEFCITAKNTAFDGREMVARFEFDLVELKQAYKEEKLGGKLKELVATLKEDDNNVFVIAQFK